jgi:hypothetical protein
MKLQSKLGAWALISLVLLATVPTVGCSGSAVAQNIVNWTPVIDSSIASLGSVAESLAPQDAALIQPFVTGLVAAQNLMDAQAKTYLANPSLTNLQQLQAQALAFQQNVNTALLSAAKITNSASQQKVLNCLNAGVTGITAILALLQTVNGNTVGPVNVVAPKISQVLPLMDENQSIALVAEHYGEPQLVAAYQTHQAERSLMAAGL